MRRGREGVGKSYWFTVKEIVNEQGLFLLHKVRLVRMVNCWGKWHLTRLFLCTSVQPVLLVFLEQSVNRSLWFCSVSYRGHRRSMRYLPSYWENRRTTIKKLTVVTAVIYIVVRAYLRETSGQFTIPVPHHGESVKVSFKFAEYITICSLISTSCFIVSKSFSVS